MIIGDLDYLPLPNEYIGAVVDDDEVMLLSGDDMRGCFHVFRLPVVWRKWFALSKPIHRRDSDGTLRT
eukprot:3511912-Heterocapsa_arctica.AAC.1